MWAFSSSDSYSAGARETIRRSVHGAEPSHLRVRRGAVGEVEKMGVGWTLSSSEVLKQRRVGLCPERCLMKHKG